MLAIDPDAARDRRRRADSLGALTAGAALTCRCDRADCPARATGEPTSAGAQVIVNVIASADTLSGRNDRPGYIDGYGVDRKDEMSLAVVV